MRASCRSRKESRLRHATATAPSRTCRSTCRCRSTRTPAARRCPRWRRRWRESTCACGAEDERQRECEAGDEIGEMGAFLHGVRLPAERILPAKPLETREIVVARYQYGIVSQRKRGQMRIGCRIAGRAAVVKK